jgi:hypothetical protein
LNFYLYVLLDFVVLDLDVVRILLDHSPRTVTLNCQVVAVHLDPEETGLAPVSAPTVTTDPELDSVFLTPTDHGDLVIDHRNKLCFRENASCILLKFESSLDTTRNGSSSKDLGLHVVCTRDSAVLSHFPDRITRSSPAVSNISWLLSLGVSAVLTLLNIGTAEVIGVLSQIVLTTFFRNTVVFSVLIDTSRVSSVATSSSLAVDDHLRRKRDIRPSSVSGNVDSVSNRTGGALSPARATVCRDMLILGPREIVDSANVSPVPTFREVLHVDVLMRSGSSHVLGNQFGRLSSASISF